MFSRKIPRRLPRVSCFTVISNVNLPFDNPGNVVICHTDNYIHVEFRTRVVEPEAIKYFLITIPGRVENNDFFSLIAENKTLSMIILEKSYLLSSVG